MSAPNAFGKRLLREYSGVSDDELESHLEAIKEKALKVWPFPCIRTDRFLDLAMMTMDVYPEVLKRVKHGEKFLDLGCCFGQELRQLVADGAPSANTYGSDLWGGFFPIGYELFRDKDRLHTTFIQADIFDEASPLTELAGQISIIYVGDLFHLFNLEDQEKIATRIVQLLASIPGSLVLGRQSGSESPGESSRSGDKSGRKSFRHSPESWKALWDRIGQSNGSKWAVEADLRVLEFSPSALEQGLSTSKSLRYTIKRL